MDLEIFCLYDILGSNWEAYQQGGGDWKQYAQQNRPRRGSGGGRSYTYQGDSADFFGNSDHSDFFNMFFGGGGGNICKNGHRNFSTRKYFRRIIE